MTVKQIPRPDDGKFPETGTLMAIYNYDSRMCVIQFACRDGQFYTSTTSDNFNKEFALSNYGFFTNDSTIYIHNEYDGEHRTPRVG